MNPHNAQGSASQPHARAQQPDSWYETTTTSTSAMIGPTTTFYNPDDVAQREGTQYQQWLDTFGSQPPQEVDFSSYRRDAIQQQIPYGYMHEQYPSANPISQYAGSSGSTVRPSGVGSMGDATVYPSQPGDMPYYYNDMLASSSSSSPEQGQYQHSTPESTLHSYSNTPDPVYQQQYRQGATTSAPARTHQPPPQQQQQQQQQHRQHIPMPRHTQRQPKPPAPIAVQQQHPPQYQQARFVTHRNEATAASHSMASSLSPPPVSWGSEVVYPNQNQNQHPDSGATQGSGTTGGVVQAHAYKVPSNAPVSASSSTGKVNVGKPGGRKANQSQGFDPIPYSGGAAAPVAGPSTLSSEKLSGKRKRVKKDDAAPPEWGASGSGGGFSDSDSDDDDGSGLAMSGGLHVGMGGLGVVGKSGGRREKGGRL